MAKRIDKPLAALKRAIDVTGSQGALAEKVSAHSDTPLGQSAISNWVTRLKRVPAERVLAVEAATRGAVTRHELRPDLYPREASAA